MKSLQYIVVDVQTSECGRDWLYVCLDIRMFWAWMDRNQILFFNLILSFDTYWVQFKVSLKVMGRRDGAGTYRQTECTWSAAKIVHLYLIPYLQNLPTHLIRINYSIFVWFQEAALHELEKEPSYWDAQARATLGAALKLRPRDHQAKNIILFLGDGRSYCHDETYKTNTLTWLLWTLKQKKLVTPEPVRT